MNNFTLSGTRKFDRFNLRICIVVLLVFGILTIVSYIYELKRAGLLTADAKHKHINFVTRLVRDLLHGNITPNPAKNDDINLNVAKIKEILREVVTRSSNQSKLEDQDVNINIQVHFHKNDSYGQSNQTELKVYQHKKAMPNYFLTLNESFIKNNCDTQECDRKRSDILKPYRNATLVFFHQRDNPGAKVIQCLKDIAEKNQLKVGPPLNPKHHAEWEALSKEKKSQFDVLYGGLAFGACESIKRPCVYFTMLQHPVDRLIDLYFACKLNDSILCPMVRFNATNTTMQYFAKSQGNSLFNRLLYYSRHCKLVGQDEICLQDTDKAFILTAKEKKVYLETVLQNLNKWFGVVGLYDHFKESLNHFQTVFGYKFAQCESIFRSSSNVDHSARSRLLLDAGIMKWIQADMEIYSKTIHIFKKQSFILKNL